MLKPYFGDIRNVIIDELNAAQHDIYVAVAWFTDLKLFDLLRKKLKEEIDIRVVINKDEINQNNGFNFSEFVAEGGVLYWADHHHKFCVIDRKILIMGSYNWTYAANNRNDRENIIVIKNNPEIVDTYSAEFRTLIKQGKKFYDLKLHATGATISHKINNVVEEYDYDDFIRAGYKIDNTVIFSSDNKPFLICRDNSANIESKLFFKQPLHIGLKNKRMVDLNKIKFLVLENENKEVSIVIDFL